MNQIIRLIEARRAPPFTRFERHEFNQLLSLYSRQVAKGHWRDYAIDHDETQARFHVFRHAGERALFTIVKVRISGGLTPRHTFALRAGGRGILRDVGLLEITERLEAEPRPFKG